MKTKLTIIKLIVVLCSTVATTTVFGQVANYTWTGAADGTNLDTPGNYTTNGVDPAVTLPSGFDGSGIQESVLWDGRTTFNLNLGKGTVGWPGTGLGSIGVNLVLTANQTNDVQIISPVAGFSSINTFGITNNSATAKLALGDNTANQLVIILRPGVAGTVHHFVNNSANAVIINPNLQIQNGGGAVGHVINFQGTGDFAITNNLRFNNSAPGERLQWDSTGTTIWAAGGANNFFNSPLSNIVVNAGTVIVEGSGLLPLSSSTTTVSNGTLIVNGTNSGGSTIIYGGTLGGTGVVGSVSIQSGGTLAPGTSIGTLTISSNLNIAGNMVFEVNKSLAQSNDLVVVNGGLTNIGTGTLTVSNLGPALAVGDKFTLFSKPVQNGAVLNVVGSGALWANNLAVDGSISVSAAGPSITWIGPEAILSGGANFGHTTNWLGGSPTNGTICTFDGIVSGNLTVFSQDGIDGAGGSYPIGGGYIGASGISIDLTPTQTGSLNVICYTGVTSSVSMGFNAFRVQSGAGQLTFGDDSTRQLVAVLRPSSSLHTCINNSANPVVINPNLQIWNGGAAPGHVINFQGTGDFAITNALRFNNSAPPGGVQWDSTGTTIWAAGGVNNLFNSALGNVIINAGTVIVEGSGLLPLSFGATTTVNNGTLIVNGDNTNRSIIVNGGTLGGTGLVGTVTIQSGGTLAPGTSVGTLTISSNLNIAGNMIFEVNKSLAQSNDLVVVNGGLTNNGTGTLTVSNLGPALAFGDKFTLFSKPVQNGAALNVTGSGALWVNNLAVDGSISVSAAGPILTWTNINAQTYPGGNLGRTTNWLGGSPTNGTIGTFDGTVPGNLTIFSQDGIEGNTGNPIGGGVGSSGFNIHLTSSQTGSVKIIGATNVAESFGMGFNGVQVDSGAGQLIFGDNSTRQLRAILRPSGKSHVWVNNSTNPVIINPNLQLGNGGGSFHVMNFQGTGDFAITNALRFNLGDPSPAIQWDSTGRTIWASDGGNGTAGNTNRYDSTTRNVTINAGKVIVINADLLPVFFGTFTTVNGGTLIVNSSNTNRPVIVNGGTLGGTGVVGAVTIQSGGTLAPGSSIGTFTISSNLNLGGNLAIEVNKSLAQSNDLVVVTGGLTNNGTGTLTVSNLGPILAVGDKFTLLNKPMQNGGALNVTGAGATWSNDLAVDGSISATAVTRPTLNFTQTGNNLQFSWDTSFGAYRLQSQTNNLSVGISNNWGDYPSGGTSPVTVPIDATKETLFFRLVSTP